jgi:hypothetical protein
MGCFGAFLAAQLEGVSKLILAICYPLFYWVKRGFLVLPCLRCLCL